MRHRRRLPLPQVAGALGVSAATLSRWEQGKVVPSPESLDALLTLLNAHPQERAALNAPALFLLPPLRAMADSVEALLERFETFQIYYFGHTHDRLNDLTYLTFAAEAWPLATQSASGRRLLARIYANYAAYYLQGFHRFTESAWYANRALDLLPRHSTQEDFLVRAAIAAAAAAAHRAARPAPHRGVEMLQMWLPLAPSPTYEAWILSSMADYLCLQGETETAIVIGTRACQIAERSVIADEPRKRRIELAHIYLRAGNAEEALKNALITPWDPPHRRAMIELLWAEAHMALGEPSKAQDLLQHAFFGIERYELNHLRPRVNALAERL
jgi:transcriptional regulator with XRE-family HTH domain